jgi:MoaA/NifB/PqqE/SkfB family radical SAM enzyme
MPYLGCLGPVTADCLLGWAYNDSYPDHRVEVEFYQFANGLPEVIGSSIANQFRADLLDLQYGDGSHGFRYLLPSKFRDQARHPIHARIKSNQQELTHSPIWIRQGAEFGIVAGDIVNNCNLRCPFCIVDYSKVAGLKLMSEKTLRKALELAPMTRDGHFWLSCLHEPTLHPRFVDFIEMVPENLRKKVSFTTNLCNKLSDETLERLANSNIHNIRVSFDSTNPEVFAKLRQNGRYEVFSYNLERLVKFLKVSDRRPLLRFITMAFKDNLNEIPDLVKYCQEQYEADTNEIRFTYYMPHLVNWIEHHLLTKEEWKLLEQKMAVFPASYRFTMVGPPEGYYESFEADSEATVYVAPEAPFGGPYPIQPTVVETALQKITQQEELVLKLRWDGAIVVEGISEDEVRIDVNQLHSPAAFFKTMQGFVQVEAPEQEKAQLKQAYLQQIQAQLQEAQTHLQQTQTQLQEAQTQLQEAQTHLQQTQTQLQETQTELEMSRTLVEAMRSSKFWKLRDRWLQLKQVFGIRST